MTQVSASPAHPLIDSVKLWATVPHDSIKSVIPTQLKSFEQSISEAAKGESVSLSHYIRKELKVTEYKDACSSADRHDASWLNILLYGAKIACSSLIAESSFEFYKARS